MSRPLILITNAFGVECYAYAGDGTWEVDVFDPTVSECGRFAVDPGVHYGLTAEEVAALLEANRGRDLYGGASQ